MGLEFSMWQMNMLKMEKLLTSDEACKTFLEAQFPDPDEDNLEEGSSERKAKYSVDPEDDGIYLGKSWHLLHYLIAGNEDGGDSTLDFAIMVGHPIERLGEDFCWLSPEDVLDIVDALDNLSEKDMKNRSTREAMSKFKIYRCSAGLDDEEFRSVMKDFRTLKKYYKQAAKRGNAMLRLIS
jgi:hypothetical protein